MGYWTQIIRTPHKILTFLDISKGKDESDELYNESKQTDDNTERETDRKNAQAEKIHPNIQLTLTFFTIIGYSGCKTQVVKQLGRRMWINQARLNGSEV